MSATKDSFEEAKFMKELIHLRDTQEAIQTLSAWCLKNKKSAYKIARCWLKCIKKVKVEQKLPLFYLLNDVVQHSKRKDLKEFIERFESVLKEAIPHLKDESHVGKVRRVINIWEERQVFEEKFIKELKAILEAGKKTDINDIVDSFQPHQICTQIKIMKALEDDSEYKLKTLREADINLVDFDEAKIRANLKDREHGKDYIKDVDESRKCLEDYIKAVDREITKRRQVKDLLEQAKKYYSSLYDEAEVVTNAYSSFEKKVKNVQNKLEEIQPDLDSHSKSVANLLSDADLSPMPSPDYDAPSPEPNDQETELRLPGDEEIPLPSTPEQPQAATATSETSMSISEYLTKLAHGESVVGGQSSQNGGGGVGHFFYQDPIPAATVWPDPPAATAWPAPKEWPDQDSNPVPEWQIETIDEEPPDIIIDNDMTPNLAFARLQHKQGNTLVDLTQPTVNHTSEAMEVVISDDEPEIIEHHPQQEVQQLQQQQQLHPHELSLQDRLRNLAGVPIPPQPESPIISPMHHQQPPPRPFFAERPPAPHHRGRGGPPGRGGGFPRPPPSNNFGGGNSNNFGANNRGFGGGGGGRRPFPNRGGRGRGGNFRGNNAPRW